MIFITHPDVTVDPHTPIEQWNLSQKGLQNAKALLDRSFWKTVKTIYSSGETKAVTVATMAAEKFNLPHVTIKCLGEIDRSSTV